MTPIILVGTPFSSYVRSARMTAIEKGIPHSLDSVEFRSPAHEKLHPWKRVPIMRHGDVQLIESSAIGRYLDDIGSGPKLVPATPVARAVMEQWISAINAYVYGAVIRDYAVRGYITPKSQGKAPDRAQIEASTAEMEANLARLDAAYAKDTYIAGDAVSLADLLVAPIVQTVGMFPEGQQALAKTPNLARAYALLAKRDSFAQVHAKLFD